MKLIKTVVDKRPKNCIECPLNKMITMGCGKLVNNNTNGGMSIGKIPDARCMLTREKEV